MIMKVGKSKTPGPYPKKLGYRHLPYDVDGWVNASKYLPEDYDLVTMRLKNGEYKFGWSVGDVWDGAQIDGNEEVIAWKRKGEDKENM